MGREAASEVIDHRERVHSLLESYNELVATEGDVLTWEQEWFDPQAEYRPVEDRDWFRDPPAIARSLVRWIETWGVGKHRIEPKDILEFEDDHFLVTALQSGVARASGVPIEALTYMAMRWRAGKLVWFDEYLDKEEALAAVRKQGSAAAGEEPDVRPALSERFWRSSEAAFAAFVRRRSDRQLERLFGSGPALRAVFKRMEQVFEPAKAGGFAGEIQLELLSPVDVKKWVVRIEDGRARARPGEADAPAVTLRLRVAPFVRIAARQLHPVKAYREGKLEVGGRYDLAARFSPMFGLSKTRLTA